MLREKWGSKLLLVKLFRGGFYRPQIDGMMNGVYRAVLRVHCSVVFSGLCIRKRQRRHNFTAFSGHSVRDVSRKNFANNKKYIARRPLLLMKTEQF